MAKEIEKAMHPLYSTKTEFIREAIRDKILQEKYERLKVKYAKEIAEYRKKVARWRKKFGPVKKTTYEEERKIRDEVGKEIARKFGFELD